MNALESQLDYPLRDTLPALGAVHEIAPGVLWLRMPLPFALDHINLWLLEDMLETENGLVHGWTAVDCGVATDAARDAWQAIFAGHLRGLPILRVLVTHCHPDHVGLADWLCARWNAPLWMSATEYAYARMMSAQLPGVDGTAAVPHFQRHGLSDPDLLAQLQGRKSYYPTMVPAVPASFVRMHEGQTIKIGKRGWRVIKGCGHSPEHVALFSSGDNEDGSAPLLISGDMVLPRISTNVSVFAVEPESNPVQQYLDSIAQFAELPSDTLVLPSHGKPFRGLHVRIAQLRDHHADKLAEVMAACAKPQSAADIVPIMFKRQLDAHQLTFALGEALAHLHMLWFDGKLVRTIGADGIFRFSR